jgi:hypothetical protein
MRMRGLRVGCGVRSEGGCVMGCCYDVMAVERDLHVM